MGPLIAAFLACTPSPTPVAPIVPVPIPEAEDGGPIVPVRLETVERGYDPRASELLVGDPRIPVPREPFRLDMADAAQLHASDFGPATFVEVGDGRLLVHLFAYSLLGSYGSMGGAGGRDVWFEVHDGKARVLFPGNEATMWRVRNPFGGPDSPWSESVTWLVGDADGDGLLDLGRFTESAYVRSGTYVGTQTPVRWSLAAKGFPAEGTELALPAGVAEVPRPTIGVSATDFVLEHAADGRWTADTSVFWRPPPREPRDPLFGDPSERGVRRRR